MLYEKEYLELVKDFKKELREKQKEVYQGNLNFCLLGSPLMKSDVLILGINWGGDIDKPSGEEMPLVNELLACPLEQNNKKIMKFLSNIFSEVYDLINFLNISIYTNACFIRTPNTENENNKIVEFGFQLSLPYLEKLIRIIDPKLVICFGNGENPSPTSSVSKILCGEEDWCTTLTDEQKNIIGRTSNCYFFEGLLDAKNVKIFSFPHSRNMGFWTDKEWEILCGGEIFKNLKNIIINNY